MLREAAARAETILRANWTEVERVASALLEHKTLDNTMCLSTLARKSLEGIPVVRALRLMQPGRIDLLGAMGILSGEAGDWIVDYGEGDVALVGRSKFPALYEVEG